MIAVTDVEAASRWFQDVLGLTSGHGGPEYDQLDEVVPRAAQHGADVRDGPLENPNSHQREIWLRSPDGYTVVVAGP